MRQSMCFQSLGARATKKRPLLLAWHKTVSKYYGRLRLQAVADHSFLLQTTLPYKPKLARLQRGRNGHGNVTIVRHSCSSTDYERVTGLTTSQPGGIWAARRLTQILICLVGAESRDLDWAVPNSTHFKISKYRRTCSSRKAHEIASPYKHDIRGPRGMSSIPRASSAPSASAPKTSLMLPYMVVRPSCRSYKFMLISQVVHVARLRDILLLDSQGLNEYMSCWS